MIEEIVGNLDYQNNQAYLIEADKTSLLTFDVPPVGSYDPQEAAVAFQYLRHLGVPEGTGMKILGFRMRIVTQDIIRIVRFN